MVNEFPHLCPTASVLPMGALMCTTHLLPLFRPLLLVINARNKCVTLVWIVIMENNDSSYFSTHQLPPCSSLHLWDKIRTQFLLLHLSCLMHLLRVDVSSTAWHMYGQDVPVVSVFLNVSAHDLPFILCFPFLFFSFSLHFPFFFMALCLLGVFLPPRAFFLPFSFSGKFPMLFTLHFRFYGRLFFG